MPSSTTTTESEALYAAAFTQVQECGDIISSILIIYKFITENGLPVSFGADKLRGIALRSVDKDTSTFLWHINALIAASSDFEHLLLGIEMMFDRFLGNKQLFIKEKEKSKAANTSTIVSSSSKANHKFIGNEIVSFVNSYYDQQQEQQSNEQCESSMHQPMPPPVPQSIMKKSPKLSSISLSKQTPTKQQKKQCEWQMPAQIVMSNDENENTQNMNVSTTDEQAHGNKEYMDKYRGKISSPISFRMRQQKRMMQNGRRSTKQSRNKSVDLNVYVNEDEDVCNAAGHFQVTGPQILSPFNVTKFAKKVDSSSMEKEVSTKRILQFER